MNAVPQPRLVRQVTPCGCGIACLAMLSGIGLDAAARMIGHDGSTHGVTAERLREVMSPCGLLLGEEIRFGEAAADAKKTRLTQTHTDCLLQADRGETGHWMIWHAISQRVLDPEDLPRNGSRLREVRSYYPVWVQGPVSGGADERV